MNTHFSFEVDRSRNLVKIRMSGLFSLDDIAAFIEARREAHAELHCPPNAHVTLNDIRGMKIQPQETVAAFQAMLAAPEYRSRRLAFIVPTTLTRNQLMRALASRGGGRSFEDPEAAEAWLFEEDKIALPRRRSAAG